MLKKEFSTTKMEEFPNASTYCQQNTFELINVDTLVSDQQLILQMVYRLNDAYKGACTLI